MDDQLVAENQGLVHWQAKRYLWSGVPYDDLVQEGNLGLLDAARRFDPERGTKFSTFATWCIRGRISRVAYRTRRDVSLDETIGDGNTRRVDMVKAPAERPRMSNKWRRVLATLTVKEEAVLRARFGFGISE